MLKVSTVICKHNQKIDAQGFTGVRPGIESLRNFYQAFGLHFPDHKY